MQIDQSKSLSGSSARSAAFPYLDWAVGLGGVWLITGLYLDGWAHHHLTLESFFSPWHAVLYSGFFISAASVGLAFLNGLRQGRPWREALPIPYRASLLGSIIFLFGGLADMTWHTLFGIEQSLDALLSPPHLVLALGASLLITGPLRAAVMQAQHPSQAGSPPTSPGPTVRLPFPALLSISVLVALLGFFSMYTHPWIELSDRPFGSIGLANLFYIETTSPSVMVSAVLLQSLILVSAVLFLVRRFRLPPGALTFLFTFTTFLAASIHTNWGLIPLGLLAGAAADALVPILRPGERTYRTQLFAFLLPVIQYSLFFGALKLSGDLAWTHQLWTGTIFLAGIAGWLASMNTFPADQTRK